MDRPLMAPMPCPGYLLDIHMLPDQHGPKNSALGALCFLLHANVPCKKDYNIPMQSPSALPLEEAHGERPLIKAAELRLVYVGNANL